MKLVKLLIVINLMIFSYLSFADDPVFHGTIMTKSKTGTEDVIIKTRIQTIYGLSPLINHYSLNVNSEAGIVTITGALQNEAQKELAISLAKAIDGVKQIKDKIKVDSRTKVGEIPYHFGQKVIDATITSMVKSKLLLNPNTKGLQIEVTTINNVVTLQGNVATTEEKEIAEKIAIKTAGASTVRNYLTVKGS